MDNKRMIVGMLLAAALLMGWSTFVTYMYKKNNWAAPGQQPPQAQVQPATAPAASPSGNAAPASPAATSRQPGEKAALRVLQPAPALQEAALLGSTAKEDATYAMGLETSSRGASIARVTLNQFPLNNKGDTRYVFQHAAEGVSPSMATLWATVNGQRVDLLSTHWRLESSSKEEARYLVEIGQDKPLVQIQKLVQIAPRNDPATNGASAGYEVLVRHSVQNLSGEPVQVELGIAGPTTPPKEITSGPDRYVMAGYNEDPSYPKGLIKPTAWQIETLKDEQATLKIEKSEKGWPIIWAGLTSTYFDALVLPVGKDNRTTAEFLASVQAKGLPTPAGQSGPQDAELLFTTKTLPVAANSTLAMDLKVFLGPKARSIVKNDYYGVYPRDYAATLTTTGSCGYCTIQWLVDLMVNLLRGLEWLLRDWGLAIIGLVLIVRLFLHPLTRRSTISMHKMQKLAPEMERIKKKYADDPAEQQRQMLQFQKEYAPGMILGCLPMLIQMPIWIALWSSLQSTFELRLSPFLWGFTWIKDLAKPDALIPFDHPIPLIFGLQIGSINLLPILLGVVFWLQMKMQPKPPTMSPEQEQQQKIMQWMMPLMFPLMLYSGPAGLNLYILTSTTIGIIESKIIRDHIKAREAAEAASGPTIIDAPATRVSARRRREGKKQEPEAPKGFMGRMMQQLSEVAERARQQAEEQQKRRKKDDK